jgi:osmotically-inducible protein OsmY
MDAVAIVESVGKFDDDLVSVRVQRALAQSGYPDLRRLQCECQQGIVQLQGTVGSYFLKQMAQATAARIDGVKRIDNRLRVEASTLVIA